MVKGAGEEKGKDDHKFDEDCREGIFYEQEEDEGDEKKVVVYNTKPIFESWTEWNPRSSSPSK